MKKLKENNHLVTSTELGESIGITGERIRQLADEGIIEVAQMQGRDRLFVKDAALVAYIEYQRAQLEAKPEIDGDLTEAMQKADLEYKQARAGKMQLELAELEGQMHRAEDVDIVVTDMLTKIRGAILALPGRLAVDTANAKTAAETSAIIKAVVDDTLNELSEYRYNPAEYKKLVSEREKWLTIKEAETAKAEKAKAEQPKKTTTKSQKPKQQSTSKSSRKS